MSYLWSELQPLGANNIGWINIACNSTASVIVACIYDNLNGYSGVWISTNSGVTWSSFDSAPLYSSYNSYWSATANGNIIVAGGALQGTKRLYVSTNQGTSFTETQPAGNQGQNWFTLASSLDGSIILAGAGDSGSLYLSGNYGSSWSLQSVSGPWFCAASNSNGTILIAGQSSGRLYVYAHGSWSETRPEGNNSRQWLAVGSSSDGSKFVAVSHNDGFGNGGYAWLSVDSGSTWTQILITGLTTNQNWTCAAISADGSTVIIGYNPGKLYLSTDSGATWNVTLPTGNPGDNLNYNSLVMAQDGSKILAAVHEGRLYEASFPLATAPTFVPDATSFSGSITVTIDSTAGSAVYYTGDGLIPTTSSNLYTAPLTFYDTTVLSAIAAEPGYSNSNVKDATYTATVVNRYWVSNVSSNWNNTSNWAVFSGGSGGASVPTVKANVHFDGSGSGLCLIDVPLTIYGLYLMDSYDSSVVQNGKAMTIVTTASFDGGSFLGDPSSINAGTVYLGAGIIQDATVYISQDMSCVSSHNQWSALNNSLLIMEGSGQQNLYAEVGGVIPYLTINKSDNTQVFCYGNSPITILNDFIIQDGTFNTNGLDLQVGI
jgi:hypothetical protein